MLRKIKKESLGCADAEGAAWSTEFPTALGLVMRAVRGKWTGRAPSLSDLGPWTFAAAVSTELEKKKQQKCN